MSLALLWETLPYLRHTTFFAGEQVGRASLSVQSLSSEKILIVERGSWQTRRAATFYNRLLWKRVDEGIQLFHIRWSLHEPTLLAVFKNDTLVAHKPHLCRQDVYEASIHWTRKGFCLQWDVTGPHKHHRILSLYESSNL